MKVDRKRLLGVSACLAMLLLVPTAIAEASFLPSYLSGNVLWLDASDTNTIAVDSVVGTFTWNDKSTAGNTLTSSGVHCPTSGIATQNGLNLITFDASVDDEEDWLDGSAVLAANDDTYTYIAVWFSHDSTKTQTIYEQASSYSSAPYNKRAALLAHKTGVYGFGGQYNDAFKLAPYSANTWQLTALQVNNTDATTDNITVFDDGDVYSGLTSSSKGYDPTDLNIGTAGIRVGAKMANDGENFDGEIAEIIVFDRLLTDGSVSIYDNEINDVLYYLDQKWALGNAIAATPEVPEPSALTLIAIGFAMIVGRKLRRRQ